MTAKSSYELRASTEGISSVILTDAPTEQTDLPGASSFLVIESCHSTWIFDEENRRFRRLLKGPRIDREISTDWRSYDRLVLDRLSDAFLVFLDAAGSRVIRSHRHLGKCGHCEGKPIPATLLESLHPDVPALQLGRRRLLDAS